MKHIRLIRMLIVLLVSSSIVNAKMPRYSAAEASAHIGEHAIVCGVVASARYIRSRGSPTFLNFGAPYPHQLFTALIWGDDRAQFGQPELTLLGKRICVSGKIKSYRGVAEIILRNRSQLLY